LKPLARIAKAEDPEGWSRYVNYPSTPNILSAVFGLCLLQRLSRSQERLEAYLARLQNIATTNAPLVMAELGLDSLRNGEDKQADVLDWQVRPHGLCGGPAAGYLFIRGPTSGIAEARR